MPAHVPDQQPDQEQQQTEEPAPPERKRRRPEWLQDLIDLGPTIGQVSAFLAGLAAVITALAALLK